MGVLGRAVFVSLVVQIMAVKCDKIVKKGEPN